MIKNGVCDMACINMSEKVKRPQTSDPGCCYPNYDNWEALPFSERHRLASLECGYLNTSSRLHKKQITVKLVVLHNTDYADDKQIMFDFHGAGEFFYITYIFKMQKKLRHC